MWRFSVQNALFLWNKGIKVSLRYASEAKNPAATMAAQSQTVGSQHSATVDISRTVPPQSKEVNLPKFDDVRVSPVSIPVDVVAPPNVSAFDEIPGPISLRLISRFWSYVPIVSAELTGGALFQVLNLGKFFGNILSWGGNARFFQKFFNVYGPVVRLHGPFGGDVVLLSRPEHASIVFQCEGNLPTRSCLDSIEKYRMEYRKMRQAGPFLMSGTEWEKLHKTLEKPMQMCVAQHFQSIQDISDEFVSRTASIRNRQEEVPNDFQNEILKWCLESMCSITLNRRFGFLDPCGLSSSSDPGRLLEGIIGATEAIRKCEYGFHVWKFVETPSWKSLVKHCDSVDGILSKYVEHAQSSLKSDQNAQAKLNASNISVLESLLSKEDVLIEDVMTVLLDMLLIGSNALAHSVAFLFYNLAKNPRCQKKVLEEIQKQQVEMSPENLKKMTYLRACIKESLRMKPPIPIINRVLQKNAIVHNYVLPKGTYVLVAAHLASMREEYFEDANKFKPERWFGQEDNSCLAKEVQYFASIPFGHGPKSCVAKELAEIQIALLTVKMLKKFRIEYNYGEIESSNVMLASPTKPLRFRFADRV